MKRYILLITIFVNIWAYASAQTFSQSAIPDSVWARMQGKSVPQGSNVKRSSLRYLRLSYYNSAGRAEVGEMICNRKIASAVVEIFRSLYEIKYPIGRIALIDDYGADDVRSMEANNTSCFCYRMKTGGKTISKHGLGLAIDINPLYNPYVKGKTVSPPSGRPYSTDRSSHKDNPMIITYGDPCYRIFTSHGFRWGGAWKTLKDYQHFEWHTVEK